MCFTSLKYTCYIYIELLIYQFIIFKYIYIYIYIYICIYIYIYMCIYEYSNGYIILCIVINLLTYTIGQTILESYLFLQRDLKIIINSIIILLIYIYFN